MELIITRDLEELSRKFAHWMIGHIRKLLRKQERFSLCLSGGQTPKRLYQLLGEPAYSRQIPWHKMDFFWGDERYLPLGDAGSNAGMALETFLSKAPVRADQIHMIDTEAGPAEAAASYEGLLRAYFKEKKQSFDLVLLGLGGDAHTLSLFPGYDIISEQEHWVRSFYLEEQKMYRISLTPPLVNKSGAVAFLVNGAEKSMALKNVLEEPFEPSRYPAQAIRPEKGALYWWIDEAAAGDLTIKNKNSSTF